MQLSWMNAALQHGTQKFMCPVSGLDVACAAFGAGPLCYRLFDLPSVLCASGCLMPWTPLRPTSSLKSPLSLTNVAV